MSRWATALALLALLTGCGGGGGDAKGGGPLTWDKAPYSGTPSELLPDDHVVLGTVRNDSLRRLRVYYKDVRLVTADGKVVPAAVRFTNTPGHGLYPPTREPNSVKESEDLRIGRAIKLEPGKTAPLVVAWRGDAKPVAVDYRTGRLALPAE
jgi:hypothetical protein